MCGRSLVVFITPLFFMTFMIVPGLSTNSRSVNLNLETSFLFDPKDIKDNATFLANVQKVIDKLKTVLSPNDPIFRQHDEEATVLTDFLTAIGNSLMKFDDEDLKKFIRDLSAVVQKVARDNDVFNEIVEDKRLKTYVINTAKELAVTDPITLKVDIARYVTKDDSNPIAKLFRILNKFFDSTDEAKFKKLQKKFEKAKKDKKFSKFIAKTVDFVVFKRYEKMNFVLKTLLKHELTAFTELIIKQQTDRAKNGLTGNPRRLGLANINRAQEFSESNREEFSTESVEFSTTQMLKQNVIDNEILINKDLQVDVLKD